MTDSAAFGKIEEEIWTKILDEMSMANSEYRDVHKAVQKTISLTAESIFAELDKNFNFLEKTKQRYGWYYITKRDLGRLKSKYLGDEIK